MKYLKYLIIILCLVSCKANPTPPIEKDKFASILVDIHTVEGLNSVLDYSELGFENQNDLYRTVLAKHNIDKTLFDSCVMFYSRNIDLYSELYERVIDTLNKRKSVNDILLADSYKRDTLNIWNSKASISVKSDSIKLFSKLVPFKQRGFYRLSFDLKVGKLDKGISNIVLGCFKTVKDSVIPFDTVLIKKDTIWHSYELRAKSDTFRYKSLTFKFMQCKNIDSLKFRNFYIRNIKLFNPIELDLNEKMQDVLTPADDVQTPDNAVPVKIRKQIRPFEAKMLKFKAN